MDPDEMQAVITELEHQRSMLGARAAEYARQNFKLMREMQSLQRKLDEVQGEANSQRANGVDRMPRAENLNG